MGSGLIPLKVSHMHNVMWKRLVKSKIPHPYHTIVNKLDVLFLNLKFVEECLQDPLVFN